MRAICPRQTPSQNLTTQRIESYGGMARQFMSGIPYKRGNTMNLVFVMKMKGMTAKRSQREDFGGRLPGRAGISALFRGKALRSHFLPHASTGTLALDFEIPEPPEEIEELLWGRFLEAGKSDPFQNCLSVLV